MGLVQKKESNQTSSELNEAKSQLEKMDSAKTKAVEMSHQLQQQIDQLTLKNKSSDNLVSELTLQKQTLEADISTLKNEVKKLEATVLEQNFKINTKEVKDSKVQTNSMLNLNRKVNFLQNKCEK